MAINTPAIQRLLKDKEFHQKTLDYVVRRLKMSEEAMRTFYDRWNVAEKLYQAYIKRDDYEKMLSDRNDTGAAPRVISVQVPYAFSTISTICTYLINVFAGRRPIFQVSTYAPDYIEAAKYMELALQYNADHTRLVAELWKFLLNTQIYGLGALRTSWTNRQRPQSQIVQFPQANMWGDLMGQSSMKTRRMRTVYSGNDVYAIDPYLFFPDPRVQLTQVNKKGEFVFWREFTGKFNLLKLQMEGVLHGVDRVTPMSRTSGDSSESERGLRMGGTPGGGSESWRLEYNSPEDADTQTVQVDIGTIELIPSKLGLSDTDTVQKWIFVIANKKYILMADPFECDHDMHPVSVAEPLTQGYEFGAMSMAEYIKPLNDTLTWLVNSHIYNVRTSLNNMYIVDPALIEMQDLKNPGPGRHIRLKPAASGIDVRTAIQQLVTQDMTSKHFQDAQQFMNIGERISAATQNFMGQQDTGGRKTATEVRTAGEAAASRLASMAMVISAQAMVDLRTQMCLNIQQFQDQAFYANVLGPEGSAKMMISPDQLVGDFYFPIHDGTLPIDRGAMAMVWKEILQFVASSPVMMQHWDIHKIFETTAQMAGATNIDAMRLVPAPLQGMQDGDLPINPQALAALQAIPGGLR